MLRVFISLFIMMFCLICNPSAYEDSYKMEKRKIFDGRLNVMIPAGIVSEGQGVNDDGSSDYHFWYVCYSDRTFLQFTLLPQSEYWLSQIRPLTDFEQDRVITAENAKYWSMRIGEYYTDYFSDVKSEELKVNGGIYTVFTARHKDGEYDNSLFFIYTGIYVDGVLLFVEVKGSKPKKLEKIITTLKIPVEQPLRNINLYLDELEGIPGRIALWDQEMKKKWSANN